MPDVCAGFIISISVDSSCITGGIVREVSGGTSLRILSLSEMPSSKLLLPKDIGSLLLDTVDVAVEDEDDDEEEEEHKCEATATAAASRTSPLYDEADIGDEQAEFVLF